MRGVPKRGGRSTLTGMWRLVCVILALWAAPAFAQQRAGGQRSGSGPNGGGKPSPQQTAEEKERAANAKQWQSAIDQVRANSAPPPLPKIRFPTANESFLGSLKWAENPKQDMARYLDKLWKEGKDPAGQKTAVAGLWQDAEKPTWARPAIEDYYAKHSGGQSLRAAPEPATVEVAPAATAAPTPTPAPAPAAATATAVAPPKAAGDKP